MLSCWPTWAFRQRRRRKFFQSPQTEYTPTLRKKPENLRAGISIEKSHSPETYTDAGFALSMPLKKDLKNFRQVLIDKGFAECEDALERDYESDCRAVKLLMKIRLSQPAIDYICSAMLSEGERGLNEIIKDPNCPFIVKILHGLGNAAAAGNMRALEFLLHASARYPIMSNILPEQSEVEQAVFRLPDPELYDDDDAAESQRKLQVEAPKRIKEIFEEAEKPLEPPPPEPEPDDCAKQILTYTYLPD